MASDSSTSSSVPAGVQTAFNISRRSLGTTACPPNPTVPQGIATASAVLQSVLPKSGETDMAVRSAKALNDRGRRLSRDPPAKAPQQLPAPTRSMGDGTTKSAIHGVGSATSSLALSSTPSKVPQSHVTSSPAAATPQTTIPFATLSSSEANELQQGVEELRRAREIANARQAELVQLAGAEVEAEACAVGGLNAAALASEVEALLGRVGALENENAQLEASSEAKAQASRSNLEASSSETRELSRNLESSLEDLSRERARTKLLESELDQAHARVAADAAAEVEELRRCAADLEQRNVQLQCTVERLSQDSCGRTNEIELTEAFERERVRAEQMYCELERLRVELLEAQSRAVGKRSEGPAVPPLGGELEMSNGSHGTEPVDASDSLVSFETPEVRMLRSELAKRDRELLAAASARRRTADQSERTAAALRAKLAELEAIVAATPSGSSRASSPPRSEGGSPFQLSADRGIQTDLDALSLSAAVDVATLSKDAGKRSPASLGARLRMPSSQACDDVDKAVTAELLTGQSHMHNSIL